MTLFIFLSPAVKPSYQALRVTKLLLGRGANVTAEDENGQTPIYYTTQADNAESAKAIIEKDAHAVNHTDKFGRSPLFVAAENGASKVILALIRGGANVNETTSYGQTALHVVAKTSSKS